MHHCGAFCATWRIATKSGQGKKGSLVTVVNDIGECAAATFKGSTEALLRQAKERRGEKWRTEVVFVDDMPNLLHVYMVRGARARAAPSQADAARAGAATPVTASSHRCR